jgi:hypothetical protein
MPHSAQDPLTDLLPGDDVHPRLSLQHPGLVKSTHPLPFMAGVIALVIPLTRPPWMYAVNSGNHSDPGLHACFPVPNAVWSPGSLIGICQADRLLVGWRDEPTNDEWLKYIPWVVDTPPRASREHTPQQHDAHIGMTALICSDPGPPRQTRCDDGPLSATDDGVYRDSKSLDTLSSDGKYSPLTPSSALKELLPWNSRLRCFHSHGVG